MGFRSCSEIQDHSRESQTIQRTMEDEFRRRNTMPAELSGGSRKTDVPLAAATEGRQRSTSIVTGFAFPARGAGAPDPATFFGGLVPGFADQPKEISEQVADRPPLQSVTAACTGAVVGWNSTGQDIVGESPAG